MAEAWRLLQYGLAPQPNFELVCYDYNGILPCFFFGRATALF